MSEELLQRDLKKAAQNKQFYESRRLAICLLNDF